MAAPTAPTFTLPARPLTWFITGCSSGFGLALARLALERGHRVVASSRNPARTPELVREVEAAGGRWVALDVDAADSAETLRAALGEGDDAVVDVLVNNAGWGLYGAAEQMGEDETRRLFDTLFFGAYRLTRAVVPAMRARRFGVVVNISSAAAVGAVPTMAVYGAAKAALDSVHKTLAAEVRDFNVRILSVNPATFDTGMPGALQYQAAPLDPDYAAKPVGQMLAGMRAQAIPAKGDLAKGVRAIYDVVMGEGPGAGHLDQDTLPLGGATHQFMTAKIARMQQTLDVFGDLCKSCDK